MASTTAFATAVGTAVAARIGVVATAAVVALVACASPTLPLPPPEAPVQSVGVDADHVQLTAGCGGAEDGATIVIINQNAPLDKAVGGALATGCGSWDSSVYAHSGDVLSITQDSGGVSSPGAIYTVR
jgi:hypothetical protein